MREIKRVSTAFPSRFEGSKSGFFVDTSGFCFTLSGFLVTLSGFLGHFRVSENTKGVFPVPSLDGTLRNAPLLSPDMLVVVGMLGGAGWLVVMLYLLDLAGYDITK